MRPKMTKYEGKAYFGVAAHMGFGEKTAILVAEDMDHLRGLYEAATACELDETLVKTVFVGNALAAKVKE